MTSIYEGTPNPRRVLWQEQLDRDLEAADIETIESELDIQLYGVSDPNEFTLGGRILKSGNAHDLNATYLEVRRRHDPETLDWLPGVELSLITTLDKDDGSKWEELHKHVASVLANLRQARSSE